MRVECWEARFFSERSTRNFFMSACLSRLCLCRHRLKTGHGTRDTGQEYGRARLLPSTKRQRMVTGDWRPVRLPFFWRLALPHCRKISALNNRTLHSALRTEHRTSHPALKFWLTVRPPKRRINSALRKNRHQPLAKASGKDKGLDNAPKQIMAKALTFCTLALMHACTQNRL